MYNFCVVLARWGIFVKNDKCLVWNSLIERILILKRPRSFTAPLLVSLRLEVEVNALDPLLLNKSRSHQHIRKRRKEPRWNLHKHSANGEKIYPGKKASGF